MANRYPLVVDTTNGNKIRELPSGDSLQLTGNNIIGVVGITASGTIGANEINATSIKKGGVELANVAVTGAFADLTGSPTQLSDLTDDLNVLVPGDNVGTLTNNVGYLTTVAFADLTAKPTTIAGYGITDAATSAQGGLAATAVQPGASVSVLSNDAGYLTLADIQNGAVTIDVNNTGDLVGSVFADDSTVLIDSILAAVNLDGTIRGHVRPNANQHNLWDLGTDAVRFKNAYFAGTINGAHVGTLDGDVEGSVFGDDSTLLVDGINNKIVGAVETSSLRTSEYGIALGNGAGQSSGLYSVAIGYDAGKTSQGNQSIAIGEAAGMTTQDALAVAIGTHAGYTTQGASAVAVGDKAGETTQGAQSIAIGDQAGQTTQGDVAVAIGTQAGMTTQGLRAIAIGLQAAEITQANDAIAIGNGAGYNNQGQSAIAIGAVAGNVNQAARSIVISAAGVAVNNTTADSLVIKPIRSAVGTTMLMYDATSGEVTHTASPVITGDITGSVFGDDSTLLVDGINNKIVGDIETSSLRTSETIIALGYRAGLTTQGASAVAIGYDAGRNTQGASAVAVGPEAGDITQGASAVAIGAKAGYNSQSDNAVAIGDSAGEISQGDSAVAVGKLAGYTGQDANATAVGYGAGEFDQGAGGVAIGNQAGYNGQGASAVAIGQNAGYANQHANSIVLNATGNNLQTTVTDQLVIKPIRSAVGTTTLMYNATTGEVTHSGIIQESFSTTNGATGNTTLDCSTGNVHYLTAPTGDIIANFSNLNLTAEYATNVTVVINQGATEYEITAVKIGGVAQTIVWQGNSAPTGTANGVDSFSFTILNDGGTYVVLGQMVAFGGV